MSVHLTFDTWPKKEKKKIFGLMEATDIKIQNGFYFSDPRVFWANLWISL